MVVGVLRQEGGERPLGAGIVGLPQQPEGIVVLLLRRGAGQRGATRGDSRALLAGRRRGRARLLLLLGLLLLLEGAEVALAQREIGSATCRERVCPYG